MRLTGSRTALFLRCQHWARDDVPELPREESVEASAGIRMHRIIEVVGKRYAAEWTREELEIANNVSEWVPRNGEFELVCSYDPISRIGSIHPGISHRYYTAISAHEIPMTLDYVNFDSPTVRDWKTGQQHNLEPAAENPQLLLGALVLRSRFENVDPISIGIVYVNPDGTIRAEDVAIVDDLDLDLFADELAEAWNKRETATPCMGPWCRDKWCPALPICPAVQAAAADTVSEVTAIVGPRVDNFKITSPEDAHRLHTAIRVAEEYSRRVVAAAKGALSGYLEVNGPVTTSAGTLALVNTERRTIRPLQENAEAMQILKTAFGSVPDALKAAVKIEMSTTFEALKKAAAMVAEKGKASRLVRDIEEQLTNAGAVSVGVYPRVVLRDNNKGDDDDE